jgi:hypothetical protein
MGDGGIHTIRLDGSGPLRISQDRGWNPTWSAHGGIAYESSEGIVAVAPDGSDRRVLVASNADRPVHSPAWSPDGQRIAYLRREQLPGTYPSGSGLWIAQADGSDAVRVATMDCCVGARQTFSWSPDGSQLIWVGTEAIFVQSDGSGNRTVDLGEGWLSRLETGVRPSWRPVP